MKGSPITTREDIQSQDALHRRPVVPLSDALRSRIRERMDQLGLGVAGVEVRTGGHLSRTSVHRIVHGQVRTVRSTTLAKLAAALDLEPAALHALGYGGSGQQPWVMPPELDAFPLHIRPEIERALMQLMNHLSPGAGLPVDTNG